MTGIIKISKVQKVFLWWNKRLHLHQWPFLPFTNDFFCHCPPSAPNPNVQSRHTKDKSLTICLEINLTLWQKVFPSLLFICLLRSRLELAKLSQSVAIIFNERSSLDTSAALSLPSPPHLSGFSSWSSG